MNHLYPPHIFFLPNKVNYRQLFIVQIFYVGIALLFNDLANILLTEYSIILTKTLFFVTGSIYMLMLWNLLRVYYQAHEKEIKYLFIILNITFLASLYAANPWIQTETGNRERIWLFVIHIILFGVEINVIWKCVLDLYKTGTFNAEKMWGIAALFMMIGIAFGSLYDLICILKPGALGIDFEQGVRNYMECLYYSFTVIGGVDPAYSDTLKIIKNIGVIEAVWNQLFVVILVGRMLAKPTEDD